MPINKKRRNAGGEGFKGGSHRTDSSKKKKNKREGARRVS